MKKFYSLIAVIALAVSCVFALISCNQIADNTEHFDAITKTCKLTKSYEGKSFLTDGIGKATVDAYTDGDTTRFKLEQGDIVIIRYYSIDTPESTGGVEKWGKAASNFTKSQLKKATEIVLDSPIAGQHDSYGERYLGYVWYKTADDAEFKNLNLELVENGYSENKGQDTNEFPYDQYFVKAENFARKIQLRVFSQLPDPLYSEDPIDVTLKEMIADLNSEDSELYNAETESGARVRFTACLTAVTVSQKGTYMFTAVDYDRQTGETYCFNVYAGYQSANESKMKIGHLYEITGALQLFGGEFQVSGLTYSTRYELPGYTTVKQHNYYNIFDSDMKYLVNYNQALYTNATVTQSSVADGVLTVTATAQLRTGSGVKDDVKTFTFKVNVANDYVNELTEGTHFSVSGYQFTADSGVIDILDYNDITIKTSK